MIPATRFPPAAHFFNKSRRRDIRVAERAQKDVNYITQVKPKNDENHHNSNWQMAPRSNNYIQRANLPNNGEGQENWEEWWGHHGVDKIFHNLRDTILMQNQFNFSEGGILKFPGKRIQTNVTKYYVKEVLLSNFKWIRQLKYLMKCHNNENTPKCVSTGWPFIMLPSLKKIFPSAHWSCWNLCITFMFFYTWKWKKKERLLKTKEFQKPLCADRKICRTDQIINAYRRVVQEAV